MEPNEVYPGQTSVYEEAQIPRYIILVGIIAPITLLISGIFMWSIGIWFSILMSVIAGLLLTIIGGLRTFVTSDTVKIRFGILRIRILNIKTADITHIDIHEFSPLKDFGGYGIRFGGGMKAYFLEGNRGVKLTLANGKKYLIGSYNPDNLADAIRSVSEVVG
jgi:hypothetical protein